MNVIVSGEPESVASLGEWFRNDRHLDVSRRGVPTQPERMGLADELVVNLFASGSIAAMCTSLSVWFRQRRSDVTLKIDANGKTISVDAKRVADLESLLDQVLRGAGADDPTAD